jgi:Flp pilus assembly protein TadD
VHLVLFLATLFASTAFAGSEVEDLILAGRFADAAPIAEKQAEAAPNDLRSQVQYIDVMAALGLASAVEPIYIRQSEAAPTDADAQFLRGRAATSLERAEAAYRKALTLNSGHARAHAGIGTIRRVQGDLESAETSFRSR